MGVFSQYFCFLETIPLPVSPEKIEISAPNLNKTVNLVDFAEVNILKGMGLKEISFEMLVPSYKYPFANYSFGSMSTALIISRLEHIKKEGKPVQFIVTRCRKNIPSWWTNIKVSVEDFTVTEDANNGTDVVISINLKEYKSYSTKKAKITENADGTVEAKFDNPREAVTGGIAPTFNLEQSVLAGAKVVRGTIEAGKTLYNFMKVGFGKTDMSFLSKLKALNGNLKNIVTETIKVKLPNG